MKSMSSKIRRILLSSCIIISMLIFITFFQGCDGFRIGNSFLKKPPSSGVNIDSVFSNPTTAKQVLWHAYQTLPWGGLAITGPYDTDGLCKDPLASITDIS